MMNHYVYEKTVEYQEELLSRRAAMPKIEEPKPLLGPLAFRAGRVLQRIGDSLESWGNPEQVSAGR